MSERFRYVVFGSGMQGCAAGYDFAMHGDATDVLFLDRDSAVADDAARRVNRLAGRDVARAGVADASDEASLTAAFRGVHGVLSAAPYRFNLIAARAAVAARACFNDLGGNTDVVRQELELDAEARTAGVSVVPDCGLAPGLGNILAAHLFALTPGAKHIHVRCGGLPQKPRPPLGYKLVFNIGGLTNEYTGDAEFLRNGKLVRVRTITEPETQEFPEPIGRLEACVTSGGTSTAPESFLGRLETYDYKTCRYPGHFAQIRTLIDLGLLDLTPVMIDGVAVVPREVFHRVAAPRLSFPEDRDLVVLRVVCRGEKGGRVVERRLDLLDFHDERTGFTAMERTTAFPAAAVLHFQAQGRVPSGAVPPERALPLADYVAAVRARGLDLRDA